MPTVNVERLAAALRDTQRIRGWDWSRTNTRIGDFGWVYTDVLREHIRHSDRVLDVGTGGGEVFSAVARPRDVALDFDRAKLTVACERLPCPLVEGDQHALPFRPGSFDVVADRHVGVDPLQVMSVLRPGGFYVTQQPGGHICQNIFDAFGWGTNGDFWRRENEAEGRVYLDVSAQAQVYADHGCTIVRRETADVDYEFLDEGSLAFWLLSAPLPEVADPDVHADVLPHVPLKTNWHSELLVVRTASADRADVAPSAGAS
jgi:SAM-dependent methyltransferase